MSRGKQSWISSKIIYEKAHIHARERIRFAVTPTTSVGPQRPFLIHQVTYLAA